jgi:hypothetical protein
MKLSPSQRRKIYVAASRHLFERDTSGSFYKAFELIVGRQEAWCFGDVELQFIMQANFNRGLSDMDRIYILLLASNLKLQHEPITNEPYYG